MEICVLLICLPILQQSIITIFCIPGYRPPSSVDFFRYFMQFMQDGNMGLHITITLYEISVGAFWSVILGMILDYLLVKNRLLEHLLTPLLLIIQISLRIPIAPLFILWFGFGLTSGIALVILVVSFPTVVAGSSTSKKINSGYRDLMNILQTNRWWIFIRTELPCTFHEVISGNKVAVTQAITSAVIRKMMGAKTDLGYPLINGTEMYNLNMILSSVSLLSLLGLLLYGACQVIEYRALYWK